MRRVTRSLTNAETKAAVERPKYTEASSDIEDEKPVVKAKPRAKYQSRQLARKSTTKTEMQSKKEKSALDETKVKEEDEKGDDLADEEISEKKYKKKESGKAKSVAEKVNEEEVQDEDQEADEEEASGFVNIDYELSEKELRLINKAFDMNLPRLGDENLTSANVKTAMRHLGYEPRVVEIRELMKRFSNSKNKVNRDGFHKIMAYKYSTSPGMNDKLANDEITKVFNLFDVDKTGKISLDNLKSIAKELNEELTDEDLLEMIAEADKDGDTLIDKIEFQNIMKKTSLY